MTRETGQGIRNFLLFGILLTCALAAQGHDDVLDYLFDDLHFDDKTSARHQQRIEALIENGEFEKALETATLLADRNVDLAETEPELYGRILVNLGILYSVLGQAEEAWTFLEPGFEYLSSNSGPFHETLMNALMAKGLTLMDLERLDEAEEAFRHAQHIAHRAEGVYTPRQLNIINYITRIELKKGKVLEADLQQEFNLRISEQAYGKESVELVPILQRLGSYFASRGDMISPSEAAELRFERDSLFRQSLELYQRAIRIIEQNYGENDPRLVEPLRGLARARLLQSTNRRLGEVALERALEIVESNPDSDLPDRVTAMIHLADMYTITGDRRAADLYLKAWKMMEDEPGYEELSARLFGSPTRLYPDITGILYLTRRPDAAMEGDVELYIDAEYTVAENGKVKNIRFIDKNVPNSQAKMLRSTLAGTRFRPRIIDGELVATENLILHQTFQVLAPDAEQSITLDLRRRPAPLVPDYELPQLRR